MKNPSRSPPFAQRVRRAGDQYQNANDRRRIPAYFFREPRQRIPPWRVSGPRTSRCNSCEMSWSAGRVLLARTRKTPFSLPLGAPSRGSRSGVYLIPDVSVFYPVEPTDPFPSIPPLIAAEILSPEDRFLAVCQKLRELSVWGVKHMWLVDPYSKAMYTWDQALTEVPTLCIPELGLEVTPADVFES